MEWRGGMMKKTFGVLLVVTLFIKILKYYRSIKNNHTTFFLMKDTPYYSAKNNTKCGVMPAMIDGKRQTATVETVLDKKWAQLVNGDMVKLSYLQLNVHDVTRLMANDDVYVYAAPSKKAPITGRLKLGQMVNVSALTDDRHFAKIHTTKITGYVPFAYMKY